MMDQSENLEREGILGLRPPQFLGAPYPKLVPIALRPRVSAPVPEARPLLQESFGVSRVG